ncbi:hypothetical protein NDU88_004414 [Pleurodeles waltl]|uniref:Uncharacterized protein n=1 Tax=Pleurodeles waltl TaxID=8319 RepID=A0AAV7KZU6_PLEWA|nr:hypothetical protein NDU88_004414 [Pleurodeles waltl]
MPPWSSRGAIRQHRVFPSRGTREESALVGLLGRRRPVRQTRSKAILAGGRSQKLAGISLRWWGATT